MAIGFLVGNVLRRKQTDRPDGLTNGKVRKISRKRIDMSSIACARAAPRNIKWMLHTNNYSYPMETWNFAAAYYPGRNTSIGSALAFTGSNSKTSRGRTFARWSTGRTKKCHGSIRTNRS